MLKLGERQILTAVRKTQYGMYLRDTTEDAGLPCADTPKSRAGQPPQAHDSASPVSEEALRKDLGRGRAGSDSASMPQQILDRASGAIVPHASGKALLSFPGSLSQMSPEGLPCPRHADEPKSRAGQSPQAHDSASPVSEEAQEVLLPRNEVPGDLMIMDPVDVFLYRDSEDRLVATLKDPYIHIGEVRRLKVKDVGRIGAFLDWGLPKDLLLPFGEQKGRPAVGESVDVKLTIDKSGRLCASMWVAKDQVKEGAYESGARQILELLKEKNGFLPLTDRSSPDMIREMTGMSKKEFKRAVGNLYKNRTILLEETGIRLKKR